MAATVRRSQRGRLAATGRTAAVRGRAALAVVLAVALAPPDLTLGGGVGLDPSWAAGLHLALRDGMVHGRDVVFTHGPLGALAHPALYVPWVGVAAQVAALGAHVALGWVVLRAARRVAPTWAAAAIAVLALRVVADRPTDEVALLALAGFVVTIAAARAAPLGLWRAGAIGAAGGTLALVKVSTGATAVAVAVAAAAALCGPAADGHPSAEATGGEGAGRPAGARAVDVASHAAAAVAGVVVAFVAGWIATGAPPGAIPAALAAWSEVVAGYPEAMAASSQRLNLALGAALAALALGAAALLARRLPALRSAAVLAPVAIVLAAAWKHGVVRQDGGHTPALAAASAVLLAVVGPEAASVLRSGRPRAVAAACSLGAAALALLVAAVVAGGLGWLTPLSPVSRAAAAVATTLSPGALAEAAAEARDQARRELAVPAGLVERVRAGGGVHVEPWEASVAWAYGLRWDPVPVFQSYSAYTAGLDELGARRLRTRDGPRWVLRDLGQPAIDRRRPTWEAPATTLELLCRYREVDRGGRWALLERSGDACGSPVAGSSHRLGPHEGLSLAPPPGRPTIVLARIQVDGPSGGAGDLLRRLLTRPQPSRAVVDGTIVRLVPATAGSGVVVHLPPRHRSGVTADVARIEATDRPLRIQLVHIPLGPTAP